MHQNGASLPELSVRRYIGRIAILGVLGSAIPAGGEQIRAQSLWISTDSDYTTAIEVSRPYVIGGRSSGSFQGTAAFLTLRFPFPGLHPDQFPLGIWIELPFAHDRRLLYSFYSDFSGPLPMWDEPRTTMGNPYLGLEWPTRTPGLVWEIGFRLSQIEEYPGENMREVDPDRQEAFWTDTAQTQVMLDYSPPGHGRWDVRLRGGVVVDRYTGELTFLGNDGTFLRYGVRGKRSVGPAVLAFGVCGWVNTTLERGLMPAERTGEQCSFGLGTRLGWLETMLIFNVQPWKRQRENTRYVLMLLLSAGY